MTAPSSFRRVGPFRRGMPGGWRVSPAQDSSPPGRVCVPRLDMGMQEWIAESRFVASLGGYALTGDTLHQGPNTWPVAGVRAEVFDDAHPSAGGDERLSQLRTVVVLITIAGDFGIFVEVPAKKLEQAHFFARKINQASVYFTAKVRDTDGAPTRAT